MPQLLYTVIAYYYAPGHDVDVIEFLPLWHALRIMADCQQCAYDAVELIQSQYT